MTQIRLLELSENGAPSFPAPLNDDQSSTPIRVTPDAFETWTSTSRWFRITSSDGSSSVLYTAAPRCVVETTTQTGGTSRVCAPLTSGPGLFLRSLQIATFSPASVEMEPLFHLESAVIAWLQSEGASFTVDEILNAALRFEYGWGPDLLEREAWFPVDNDWIAVSLLEQRYAEAGDGTALRYSLMSMRAVALSMSTVLAADVADAYADDRAAIG